MSKFEEQVRDWLKSKPSKGRNKKPLPSKGLEALKQLMNEYYEMCEDTGNNDDMYQKCNLTSERAIIEKELKAYSKLKEIIKDKIEKLNKKVDEMDKKIEENENAFADEDFKDDYNYCEDQLLAFDFVLKTMEALENEKL